MVSNHETISCHIGNFVMLSKSCKLNNGYYRPHNIPILHEGHTSMKLLISCKVAARDFGTFNPSHNILRRGMLGSRRCHKSCIQLYMNNDMLTIYDLVIVMHDNGGTTHVHGNMDVLVTVVTMDNTTSKWAWELYLLIFPIILLRVKMYCMCDLIT